VWAQPDFDRIYAGNEITMMADSAANRVLEQQKAPQIEAAQLGETKIRSSAFAAVSFHGDLRSGRESERKPVLAGKNLPQNRRWSSF
jgi:hypothetical protein